MHDEINENEDIVETYDNQNESEELPFALTLPATRIHCAVHRLQHGVNDFLRQDIFNRVIVVAQKLSSKLRTPTARILLKKENLKSPKMFQETRWSSTLNLLDCLLELKEFCTQNQHLWKGNSIEIIIISLALESSETCRCFDDTVAKRKVDNSRSRVLLEIRNVSDQGNQN